MSGVEQHRIQTAGVALDFEVDCGFLCIVCHGGALRLKAKCLRT